MSRPAICIPVAADPIGLQQTLDAINALPECADALIVVAVDGADPATVAVAEGNEARTVALPSSRGSYAARNAAVAALPDDVDVVLFTDAGCLPRTGWLSNHRRALDTVAMSGGAVDITASARMTAAEWVDLNRNLRQEAYVRDDGFAATCNLAVRRKVLDEIAFDDRLRSGGDRDFGVRARAAGFDITYTANAVVEHPARRTGREVLTKARRVGTGIAAMPRQTRPAALPNRRPGLNLVRLARRRGLRRGPVWSLRVAWVDNRRARVLCRAAARQPPVPLHVVVLLGSRWDALETFSTRWREIVRAWACDDRIGALTVVDHPAMRRRGLLKRKLVATSTSWLPGVQCQTLTLPVNGQLRVTDRIGIRRAARQLRRAWPKAEHRVVIAATPFAGELLSSLRGPGTVLAFDGVDHWSMRARFPDLADRLEAGYRAGAGADVVTAVGSPLAAELRQRGAHAPVVVSNGVDLQALTRPAPRPPLDLPELPFAVYVGTLGGRIDVELLIGAADHLDGIAIVAAGPAIDASTELALRNSRVTWLGPVRPEVIPGLLQSARCGLLPSRDTGFEPGESMKLLQYLAVGLPVVSTELAGLPADVLVGRDEVEFADRIRAAVTKRRRAGKSADAIPIQTWLDVADRLLTLYLKASPS